jgi:hypothetical protein
MDRLWQAVGKDDTCPQRSSSLLESKVEVAVSDDIDVKIVQVSCLEIFFAASQSAMALAVLVRRICSLGHHRKVISETSCQLAGANLLRWARVKNVSYETFVIAQNILSGHIVLESFLVARKNCSLRCRRRRRQALIWTHLFIPFHPLSSQAAVHKTLLQ